jgi:ABC-type transporter Mla subunit MlaD
VAQSGNGVDLGAVYRLLTEVAETVRAHGERFNDVDRRLEQLLRVVNDHSRILNDHSRELGDLNARVTELHKTVDHYHEAVIGQGLHYSDLEGRVLRVERHLKLGSES